MRLLLAFATAVLVLTTASGAQAAGCKTTGSESSPILGNEVYEIPGPTGPFRYRITTWRRDCPYGVRPGTAGWSGLADERGRRLVPAKYNFVYPISATRALVEVGGGFSTQLRYYTYGRGESGPAPYAVAGAIRLSPSRYIPVARSNLEQISDVAIWVDGSETPVLLTKVREIEPLGTALQAHFRAADGTDVSRLLDLRGKPISPVLGRITRWRVVPAKALEGRIPDSKPPRDQIVTSIGAIDHPLIPAKQLYMPISLDGQPLPLPAGAIGVVPLMEVDRDVQSNVFGWAVVFPTAEGVELAPTYGTLTDALAKAGTAERYSGMQRRMDGITGSNAFIEDVMLVRSKADGLWRVRYPWNLREQPPHSMSAAAFADPDLGYRMYVMDRANRQRGIVLAQEQRERQAAEVGRAEGQKKLARIKAAGTLCSSEWGVWNLPVEAINQYLRTCKVTTPTLLENVASLADPAALAAGRTKYQGYLRDLSDKEAAYRAAHPVLPPALNTGDPWAAGLNAAMASMNASSNAFWANQNAVYSRNLSAWNSGAQNWCCGGRPQ